MNLKKIDTYLPGAIALITFAVFSPVLGFEFVNLDDPTFISNPAIRSGLTFDMIRWAFTSDYGATWIPLTWISHALDIQLFGMNPAGHHFVNILLHVACSIVLFLFLRRTTGKSFRSAMVAFLFALHPLHVQSVAWVAERKDVLSSFFWMLTMLAYVRYAEKPVASRYAAVLGLFVLSLMSKPMAVTLPFVLLLLDWWPISRFSEEGSRNRGIPAATVTRLLVEKIPLLILAAVVSVITYAVQASAGGIVTDYPIWERAARACISYMIYILKMIWPSNLSVFYPFEQSAPSPAAVLFSLTALLLVSVMVLKKRKRFPFMAVGWFWYLVTLLPVIGLVQVGDHAIADHYTYIPLIGLFLGIVWATPQIMDEGESGRQMIAGLCMAVLAVMILLTSLELRHWKNSVTLLTRAIETTDDNWLAHNNLGLTYLKQGNVDDAIWHFKESLRIKPSYVLALLNNGVAHSMKNEIQPAVEAFQQVLRIEPGNEKAHLSLGLLYRDMGARDLALGEYWALARSGSAFAPYLLQEINGVERTAVRP